MGTGVRKGGEETGGWWGGGRLLPACSQGTATTQVLSAQMRLSKKDPVKKVDGTFQYLHQQKKTRFLLYRVSFNKRDKKNNWVKCEQ